MDKINLNELKPAKGAQKARRRVGRGESSGGGKTAGRGHKGLKSRSGGTVRAGFEGGQMPLQMRLPKFGFSSRIGRFTTKLRTSALDRLAGTEVTLASLQAAGLVRKNMKRARLYLSGPVNRAYQVQGLALSQGAKAAIEAAGGKISD